MTDTLSSAGGSTYTSDTMYVGDGTWDSTKNTFLLPNLQGYNLATTQYNGMGNRFASLDEYHTLIKGHAILAVITFLFIVPAAIFIKRFSTRPYGWGERMHVYLQVFTLLLATVVLTLGWFAVGPERSLTNPHHGIGVAIYTLIWVQAIGGVWIRHWKRKHVGRRVSRKQMLHQWLGRATALLALAQVPLGLALYGSATWTFILYTLWVAFLVLLYFLLQYRLNGRPINGDVVYDRTEGRVIQEKKQSGFMSFLAPLLAGGAAAALLGRNKNKDRDADTITEYTEYSDPRHGARRTVSRSRVDSRSRAVSRSRRDSYIERDTYVEGDRDDREGGGFLQKLGIGAGLLGVGALSKKYFDRRTTTRNDEEYSAVEPDTPRRRGSTRYESRRSRSRSAPRRSGFVEESEITDTTIEPHRLESHRGPILPGPGDPVAVAAAMSAAEPRPTTARPRNRTPVRSDLNRVRSGSSSSYNSIDDSPSRRKTKSSNVGKGVMGGLGLAWLGNKFKSRREDRISEKSETRTRAEQERHRAHSDSHRRASNIPPSRRSTSRHDYGTETDLMSNGSSSVLDSPPQRLTRAHVGSSNLGPTQSPNITVPPVVVVPPVIATAQSRYSMQENTQSRRTLNDYSEFGTDSNIEVKETRRRREEAASATARNSAAALAHEEEQRRSRETHQEITSPGGVSLHVTQHHDKHGNVTLRRLKKEEEANTSRSRKARSRRRSSFESESTDAAREGRYRRDSSHRNSSRRPRSDGIPPPTYAAPIAPIQILSSPSDLEPPRPAFATTSRASRGENMAPLNNIASGYYSNTTPARIITSASEGSHGTWSAMSPEMQRGSGNGGGKMGMPVSGVGTEGDADERRRRRRAERSGRGGSYVTTAAGGNTIDFE